MFLGIAVFFLLSPISFELQAQTNQVQTYGELLKAIRLTRHASQKRIEKAVDREKVREAWETGKLIDEHVLQHKERADYGAFVITKLARDLSMDKTELYRMLEFARTYPKVEPAQQLSWSHYSTLLSLNDPSAVQELAEKAEKENWTRDQVRAEVRKRRLSSPDALADLKLPEIKPGPLHIYQVVRLQNRLKMDLGFGIYRNLSEKETKQFKAGDFVSLEKGKLKKSEEAPLFTYSAFVTQVVDGDTFHALIDLGFETTLAQRVRLRRIDAPEIESSDGKEAKALLEKILNRDQGRILLQSRELDQHGRPIADVFVSGKSVDQELLDQGLAVAIQD